MAWTSAWAVMSMVSQTTLCVQLTTSPLRAMQAPNGVWPCWMPSRAFSIARRMRSASVTGQMYHDGKIQIMLENHSAQSGHGRDTPCTLHNTPRLHVEDRVLGPILVIEMPPLKIVDRETLTLHGAAQQLAMPAGERRTAGIIRVRTLGHFVIEADHLGGL